MQLSQHLVYGDYPFQVSKSGSPVDGHLPQHSAHDSAQRRPLHVYSQSPTDLYSLALLED